MARGAFDCAGKGGCAYGSVGLFEDGVVSVVHMRFSLGGCGWTLEAFWDLGILVGVGYSLKR